MSTRMKWSVSPAALLIMGTLAMAQSQTLAAQGSNSSANSTTSTTSDPTAGQRKENQQDRIANGVQRGPLAAGETSNPEFEEEGIYNETEADPSANGGVLATKGVNKAIDDLSRAFANRDVGAFRQLCPSVPEKPIAALGKSFSYFKNVSRNFRPE